MSTRKKPRNPDHVRRMNRPSPPDTVIEERLKALLTPAVYAQMDYYHSLGYRNRTLGLLVMVAAVLLLLWRQVVSVRELARLLAREDLFWTPAVQVSPQALSQRFLQFPAPLFQRVLFELLPVLRQRAQDRSRPQPESVVHAQKHFSRLLLVDGSTLEALFRKLDALQDVAPGTLAGKIGVFLDLVTRLPEQIFFTETPQAQDTTFLQPIKDDVQAGTLLIFDRGFYDFTFYRDLIKQDVAWITRPRTTTAMECVTILAVSDTVLDQIVRIGSSKSQNGQYDQLLRLVQVRHGAHWYRYLTSVLDPAVLPAEMVADLYRRRWRMEEAFLIAKRLLNLSYLWVGSLNGIWLQIWATWLFFALLLDICDAVADKLGLPLDAISQEMVFRGFYHFIQAHHKGQATDLIDYLAAPENRDLGIVKSPRNKGQPAKKFPLTIPAAA